MNNWCILAFHAYFYWGYEFLKGSLHDVLIRCLALRVNSYKINYRQNSIKLSLHVSAASAAGAVAAAVSAGESHI
jgi:hypothetical protein